MNINEVNKKIWNSNFVNVEPDPNVMQRNPDGSYSVAQPLNNDPDIQEFGAVFEVLKNGYLNKKYKTYQLKSKKLSDFVTNEEFEMYDVILFIDGWELSCGFAVFMGFDDESENPKFLYLGKDDDVRKFIDK